MKKSILNLLLKFSITTIFAVALSTLFASQAFASTTPAITSATYKTGVSKIMVNFNVPVWGDKYRTTTIVASDFQLSETCGFSGSATISSVNHTMGNTWALLTIAGAAGGDETSCKIAAKSGSIYTVGGAVSEKTINLTSDTTGPVPNTGFGESGKFVTGNNYVLFSFDEPIFGNSSASAAVASTALTLTDGNVSGCDNFVLGQEVTVAGADFIIEKCNTAAVAGDSTTSGGDTFSVNAASIYDALGNEAASGAGKSMVNLEIFNNFNFSKVHTGDAEIDAEARYASGYALTRYNYPAFNTPTPSMTSTLQSSDFAYTDTVQGSRTLSSVDHLPNMQWTVFTFSSIFSPSDLTTATADTIARADATSIYDPWGRTIDNTGTTLLKLTDNTAPVIIAITKELGNKITIEYSEFVKISTWTSGPMTAASTSSVGDITTAGVIEGFGSFVTAGTPGDVTVPTTKNTVEQHVSSLKFIITLAGQTNGYLNSGSSIEPSGIFTPNGTGTCVKDWEPNTGNCIEATSIQSTITSSSEWDLTKPNVSSITVSDAVGSNGKIDRAVLVFDSNIKDASITNGDATLGTIGVTTGTFDTGTANDTTTTFNRTNDTANVDTTATGTNSDFTYSGSTTKITDMYGNLLSTLTPGTIITVDVPETDGVAPMLLTKYYMDNGTDGSVDRLVLNFSENVTWNDGDLSQFLVTQQSLTGFAGSPTVSTGSGTATLTLTVPSSTNLTGVSGGTEPTVAYTQSGTSANRVKDTAGVANDLASFGATSITDLASPIMVSATLGQSGGYNAITFVYSESVFNAPTGASTSSYGDTTSAGTVAGFGTASTPGDVTVATTKNTVAGNGTTTLTVKLANQTGAYMNIGSSTKPSGTFSPLSTLQDAAANTVTMSHTVTITDGTWDLTAPSAVSGFGYEAMVGGGEARMEWTAHGALADFSRYILGYSQTAGISLTSSLWTSSNDANLTTIGTNATVITGLTEGDTYYSKIYAVDTAGNVNTGSTEVQFVLHGASGGSSESSSSSTTTTTTTTPTTTTTTPVVEPTPTPVTEPTTEPVTEPTVPTTPVVEPIPEPEILTTEEQIAEDKKEIEESPDKVFIEWAIKEGIFQGNADGTFAVNKAINRAEVAAVFSRVLGYFYPSKPEVDPYTDVSKDAWYAGYIQKMKDLKFISDKASTYGPEVYASKVEFLKFAMNVYKLLSPTEVPDLKTLEQDSTNIKFGDVSATAWYAPDVAAASAKGFLDGMGTVCDKGNCFYANATITRGSATEILYNMFNKILGVTQ